MILRYRKIIDCSKMIFQFSSHVISSHLILILFFYCSKERIVEESWKSLQFKNPNEIMADTHCFIGTREVGKTKLRTTASGASNSSTTSSMWGIGGGGGGGGPRKSPQQRISDILRMRRLRLNRAKTTTASSLSDSLSESANNVMRGSARGSASRANSNSLMSNSSSDGFCRNNSGVSYQSARSTRSNMTAVSTLSSTGSSTSYSKNRKGKTYMSIFLTASWFWRTWCEIELLFHKELRHVMGQSLTIVDKTKWYWKCQMVYIYFTLYE